MNQTSYRSNCITISAKAGAFLFWLLAFAAFSAPATDFQYQGLLNNSGVPANGLYDFQFRLYDALTNGNQIGSTQTAEDRSVVNGLFFANIDFGTNAFNGTNRFLDIRLRLGASTGSYTTLTPRQAIKGAPTALYANTTDNVGNGLMTADRPNSQIILNNAPLEMRNGSSSVRGRLFMYNTGEGALTLRGPNGNTNVEVSAPADRPNEGLVAVADSGGNFQAGMYVVNGSGVVFGDVKSFIVDHPDQPGKKIIYISLEGPEAGIYTRGVARLVEGRATLELPEHFMALANARTITVQLTPASFRSKGLGYEISPEGKITVGELAEGSGSYEFSYLVHAVRKGKEGHEPVQDASKTIPEMTRAARVKVD